MSTCATLTWSPNASSPRSRISQSSQRHANKPSSATEGVDGEGAARKDEDVPGSDTTVMSTVVDEATVVNVGDVDGVAVNRHCVASSSGMLSSGEDSRHVDVACCCCLR